MQLLTCVGGGRERLFEQDGIEVDSLMLSAEQFRQFGVNGKLSYYAHGSSSESAESTRVPSQ